MTGWPGFAVAGGILLDQRRSLPAARVLCGCALVPVAVVLLTWLRLGTVRGMTAAAYLDSATVTAALPVALLGLLLPIAVRPPDRRAVTVLTLVAGVAGALLATLSPAPGGARAGWVLTGLALAALWAALAHNIQADGRMARRRTTWTLVTLALAGAVVLAGWLLLPDGVACYLTATALALIAFAVTWLSLLDVLRPIDERLLDLALVAGVLLCAGAIAAGVRLGAALTDLPSANASAAFAALLTVATAIPAAQWIRRSLLARRYGRGAISPADVALITADLGSRTDPRDLLGKAARMVASASGCRNAALTLGPELPEVSPGWRLHPLDVGGERVGTLAVESGGAEGPEPRQEEVIARLIPTVALVARAVSLAVEAELARRDVARERDLERRRILADLHDGLGPVLAGMSMQVRAALRSTEPGPAEAADLLGTLADGLARSRTDLRRIVAGISPTALDDGDLGTALAHLVESFRSPGTDGPELSLEVDLGVPVPEETQIAVYRSVAEGVTNALRHAHPATIAIRVATGAERICVEVTDDGRGGRIVPGVGLSSLRGRAEQLGGRLRVGAASPGTRLQLELPMPEGVSS